MMRIDKVMVDSMCGRGRPVPIPCEMGGQTIESI